MRTGRFSTIAEIIERLSDLDPKAAIESFQSNSIETLSYADLGSSVNKLARGLSLHGIRQSDFVVVMAPNSTEWIITCLAIIKAGAVVVPVNAQTEIEPLKIIFADVSPKMIFTTAGKADLLIQANLFDRSKIVLLDRAEANNYWKKWITDNIVPLPEVKTSDLVAVFYTSGTMGIPKGVPLTHENLMFQVNAVTDSKLIHSDDRFLLPLPLHHIYPFTIGMLVPLAAGVPIIMPQSLSGPQIMRAIQKGNATIIFGVPRLFGALHDAIIEKINSLPTPPRIALRILIKVSCWFNSALHIRAGKLLLHSLHQQVGPDLRMLCCGGAALDPKLGALLEGFGWPVAIGYGLTETAPLLTMRRPGEGRIDNVGKALPGISLRIDPSAWRTTFEDRGTITTGDLAKAGEIQARGPNITSGYRNLPDKTAEAFTQDGWFRTGDVGYLEHNRLHVLGRMSSLMVTASGKKIDPEELESYYLLNPVLKEVGVLRRQGRLVAVIVPNLDVIQAAGGGDIERLVKDALDERALHLPTYKRLSGYALCDESLLRTAMGKLQRKTLEERYDRLGKGELVSKKRDLTELALTEEDKALLEHPVARRVWDYLQKRYRQSRICLDTNPQLELDIDSLGWLTLTFQIRELSGVELDEDAIARITTIRDLLRELVQACETGTGACSADPLEDPEGFISAEDHKWLEPLNHLQSFLQLLFYSLNWLLMRLMFRLEVIGAENLCKHPQIVLTPNHASYLDPFVLAAAIPLNQVREMRWAGWAGIAFANPFNRFISRLAHGIPIDADHAVVSSLAMGSAVLKQKKSLIWFPEGRRTLTGDILPFKAGIGLVLNHYQVPVIPVYLDGTGRALAPGNWIIRPTRIRVIFGPAQSAADLEAKGTGSQPQERITRALRDCVTSLKPAGKTQLLPQL